MKYVATGVPAAEAEGDVVRLWAERPSGGDDAMFRWGYLSSPFGPGRCFVLRADAGAGAGAGANDASAGLGGSVVGSVGVGLRRIDVGGKTLTAGILGDFFVTKAHRTFFPALSMQRAALTWAKANVDLVYGFPNESAQPVIKRLGFEPLARLARYVLVLRHRRYIAARIAARVGSNVVGAGLLGGALAVPVDGFRRFVRPGISRPPAAGLALRRFDRLDERFDRLFERRAFENITVGHRDAKLLQWRFLEHPKQPSAIYGLEDRSGELRAYVVVQTIREVAHVRDLLGVDVESMAEALRLVAGVARQQECASLSFICAAPWQLEGALETLGFRDRDGAEGPRILFGHPGDSVTDPHVRTDLHHWYSTEADEDQ